MALFFCKWGLTPREGVPGSEGLGTPTWPLQRSWRACLEKGQSTAALGEPEAGALPPHTCEQGGSRGMCGASLRPPDRARCAVHLQAVQRGRAACFGGQGVRCWERRGPQGFAGPEPLTSRPRVGRCIPLRRDTPWRCLSRTSTARHFPPHTHNHSILQTPCQLLPTPSTLPTTAHVVHRGRAGQV